ncbi:hypothetical protein BROUX41_000294 [Berkeleyomyces rouxiae]|uniref:uncharacterized protein n=1 Tax=Berkeleyomyces rouxiae TaxID=2035830 RepID=UPI003B82A799
MSEVEEPRFNSLADRIKALNQQQAVSSPSAAPAFRRPPPPPPPTGAQNKSTGSTPRPPPPSLPSRPNRPSTKPPPLPRRVPSIPASLASASIVSATPPPVPPRQAPPATGAPTGRSMPSRPASSSSHFPTLHHHSSTSSERSLNSQYSMATSVETTTSTRKLPPAFGTVALPVLPPSKREREAEARVAAPVAASRPVPALPPRRPKALVAAAAAETSAPTPIPVVPSRPATSTPPSASSLARKPSAPALQARRLPPAPPKQPVQRVKPIQPVQPVQLVQSVQLAEDEPEDVPPPVPIASKPSHASIDASKRRLREPVQNAGCLHCRDFSEPDRVAAQYPRQSLPAHDAIGYLARVLCDPFPSPTDKARAIFTWHHHNIDYDWDSFSKGCVRPMTPEDVIREGKGVCAGYADCFEAIARRAGLQCIVVSGHGKGIGHVDLEPGQPVPAENATGHAWNAVQLDGGEWKLVDACWGAGSVSGAGYQRGFSPQYFCASNEVFGLRHFPSDRAHFLRADGRVPSWAEYILGPANGPAPLLFADFSKEALSPLSVGPVGRDVRVDGSEPVRIQVSRACVHVPPELQLPQNHRAYLIRVAGQWVAMKTDGFWWWIDVQPKDLGNAGETFMIAVPTQLNGTPVTGLTVDKYENRGCGSVAFSGLVQWRLV